MIPQKPSARRGAAGQQYAIMVGLVGVVALLAISQLGSSVTNLMSRTGNTLTGVVNGSSSAGGTAPNNCAIARTHCQAHLSAGCSTSGVYSIDPDGVGGNAAFDAYCDQTTMGGGWTLFSQNRPTTTTSQALNVAGAVGSLELNDTTITTPAKLSDSQINLISANKEFMAKSKFEGYGSASIGSYTDVCRINLINSHTWNSATNTPIPTSSLESTTIVCSQNANVGHSTLQGYWSTTDFTWGTGIVINTTPNTEPNYFLYTAGTAYSGGNCGTASAGRSWLGPGNWGCNAVKWYTR